MDGCTYKQCPFMCKSAEKEFFVVYIVYKHFNSAHCAIIAYVCVRFQYIPTRVLNSVVINMWVLVIV